MTTHWTGLILKSFLGPLAIVTLLPSVPTANGYAIPTIERPPIPSIDDRLISANDASDGPQSQRILAPSSVSTPSSDSRQRIVRPNPAWRIALNFAGPQQGFNLLDGFGESGIRFPVVVPAVEFTANGLAIPRDDTVSYTGIQGGVTRPIEGGTWTLLDDSTATNQGGGGESDPPPVSRRFQFTLRFPEELRKGNIVVPADTTLLLEGLLYSQNALKQLDEAFMAARSEEWKAEESLEDIYKERDGPKKWNPDTQRWERPKVDIPLTTLLSKHWTVFTKKQERRRCNAQRPRTSDMSKRGGRFPGFGKYDDGYDDDNDNDPTDDRVHMGTHGVIRMANGKTMGGGAVVGSWSAEPVIDMMSSYSTKWR